MDVDATGDTWVDEVGNVHGRLEGAIPNQKVLLVGSHIDTVKDAGKSTEPSEFSLVFPASRRRF